MEYALFKGTDMLVLCTKATVRAYAQSFKAQFPLDVFCRLSPAHDWGFQYTIDKPYVVPRGL